MLLGSGEGSMALTEGFQEGGRQGILFLEQVRKKIGALLVSVEVMQL